MPRGDVPVRSDEVARGPRSCSGLSRAPLCPVLWSLRPESTPDPSRVRSEWSRTHCALARARGREARRQ
eukprot:4015908-Prymnesium_polylepis.1